MLVALALLVALMGCRETQEPGYAAQAQQETDRAAGNLLPAIVEDLGVRVNVSPAGFVECDVSGWRYRAEGDLVGSPSDPASIIDVLSEAMREQNLVVEVRDDGSVVGRKGELSLLIGTPQGPTPEKTFRHYTFTHACAGYSDEDVSFAEGAAGTDYSTYLPESARYTP